MGRVAQFASGRANRPDPGSSTRINPSFSLRKTTLFRSQNCHLGAPNQAPAPGPRSYFSRPHPLPFPVQDPTRRRPRVGGFRGPAATCADPGKGIAGQLFTRSKAKPHPNQNPNSYPQLDMSKPTAATPLPTEVWFPLCARMVSEAKACFFSGGLASQSSHGS